MRAAKNAVLCEKMTECYNKRKSSSYIPISCIKSFSDMNMHNCFVPIEFAVQRKLEQSFEENTNKTGWSGVR